MEIENQETVDMTVDMVYQGIVYQITKEEYENLVNGWVTFGEMFG